MKRDRSNLHPRHINTAPYALSVTAKSNLILFIQPSITGSPQWHLQPVQHMSAFILLDYYTVWSS